MCSSEAVAIDEVLLISGAAGVGKSSVGWEVSVQLHRMGVAHWHLEGDVLDAAWPGPTDDQHGERLTVRTMRAMAEVFADEGYTRCVFVQTASVIGRHLVTEALGDVTMQGVLLTASDDARLARLTERERGSDLERHVESGRRMSVRLAEASPAWVRRVSTDGRTVSEVAGDVIAGSGWAAKGGSIPE